jgi:hypothetical protein
MTLCVSASKRRCIRCERERNGAGQSELVFDSRPLISNLVSAFSRALPTLRRRQHLSYRTESAPTAAKDLIFVQRTQLLYDLAPVLFQATRNHTEGSCMKPLDAYQEGCNFMRHYSETSRNVRNWALVQGLVLLTACGYIVTEKLPAAYLIAVSAFGLSFTALLAHLNWCYVRAARFFGNRVRRIERAELPARERVVSTYITFRRKLYRNFYFRLVTMHATFTIVGGAFTIFFLYGAATLLLCGSKSGDGLTVAEPMPVQS